MRGLIAFSILLLCTSCLSLSGAHRPTSDAPRFTIGVIADCQYCAVEGTGVRKYSISDMKLRGAVDHLNTLDLAYVVHLGDFIDRDYASYDIVVPIWAGLRAPGYHVLGNHDFSVADSLKAAVPDRLGVPSRYYDFAVNGWRFIVVDGNDISFYAYPKDTPEHDVAAEYYERHDLDAPKWNGALGSSHLTWLGETLDAAERAGEPVILYCHFPVFPEDRHNLWNAPEVVSLIETHPNVKAWINGHNHKGSYAVREGVHYLTLKGMVDTQETSYATIAFYADRLEVTGFGREESRVLTLRNAPTPSAE